MAFSETFQHLTSNQQVRGSSPRGIANKIQSSLRPFNLRKSLDHILKGLGVLLSFLAITKELKDQPTLRRERLDAQRRTAAGGFLDQPNLGHVIKSQVQVEAGVEHVLPWPHFLQSPDAT